MDTLYTQLKELAPRTDAEGRWPSESLALLGDAEVYKWFVPQSHGGFGWTDSQIVEGYAHLAQACLTTAFILTQRSAACRRLMASTNEQLKDQTLPSLASGDSFATVGVSHLSTSRRHMGKPAVKATKTASGYRLDGTTWWVTGAGHADHILVGAESDEGELLFWVPASEVRVGTPGKLVALTGSKTAPVHLDGVAVSMSELVAGPTQQLMGSASRNGGTGGIQTSALALGVSRAATRFIGEESNRRPTVRKTYDRLQTQVETFESDLIDFAEGDNRYDKVQLRHRANELVLKTTRSALMVSKGAGYVAGQAPGRWCREALFFLVWSVPPE